ncbi:hypothetical protein G9A89_005799 [Geosiphon pyriformis]|nr:hypothetical protein G9A89_005799 [Geosiphon pyriformis]
MSIFEIRFGLFAGVVRLLGVAKTFGVYIPPFVAIELVGFAAGGSGFVSVGLRTRSGVKNKHSVGFHSRSAFYKKLKKPVMVDRLVELSAGVSNVMDESGDGPNIGEVDSVSGVLDLNNMENVVTKETCYAESDVLGLDNNINDATPRKTHTCTYVLNSKPPSLSFNVSSDGEDTLPLLSSKFHGFNHLPPIGLCAPEKRNFNLSKLFALDIELSAVSGKTNNDKMISLKKIFYHVNGFEGVSTLSKFPGIIRSSFTFEINLNKARKLAISKKILVNNNLRKSSVCSDWEVIVKKIPVDLFRLAVKSVFSKFGKVVSIKMQLIGLWQKALDSVHVALAINNKQTWALLYTLSVGINTHDLFCLLESYSGKTCYIGHNSNSYVCDRCAVICFGDKASKLAAIGTVPVFKGVSLRWAGLSLASCTHCKQFGHVMVNCSLGEYSGVRGKRVVSEQDQIHLAGIYKKKSAPIARPAQVAGGSSSRVTSSGLVGAGLHSGLVHSSMATDSPTISYLNDRLAILEHSLELLTNCISVTFSLSLLPAVSETLTSNVDFDMIMDTALVSFGTPPFVIYDAVVKLSSSSSKVLTAKVGGLETKLIALEASVGSVLDKLNILCSGLGLSVPLGMNNPAKQEDVICWHKNMNNLISIVTKTKLKSQDSGNLSSGVAIVVDNSLARHVYKVSKVPGWLLSIKLLFKNKLLVSILGLYAGASLAVRFSQASEVNSLIARAVNESSFVILGGDFNEDGSRRCASFKKCLDLGMVNSLAGNSLAKSPTWRNSRGVVRTIDYVFISSNLVNAIVSQDVLDVSEYFDTDHQTVCVSVGLGGLLDMHSNFFRRQANRDQWKFNIRGIDESKWDNFRCATLANAAMFSDKFATSVRFSDLDVMWDVICEFYKLELLVFKIIKTSRKEDVVGFASFMDCWTSLDSIKALIIWDLMDFGMDSGHVLFALSSTRKSYCAFKLIESQNAKKANIRSAIDKRMESFEVNKDYTIRSVLEHPFCKVVLDHLVVDSELVLEPDQVMSKRRVVDNMSSKWCRQYQPLEYVFDEAFSKVMCPIGFDKLFGMVSILPDGKAAGLLGISNELWKHCDRSVLEMLLVLLNTCLAGESVPGVTTNKHQQHLRKETKKTSSNTGPWREAWEGVLTNTHPIALIKTAHKILSKVLSNRISAACSTFNVLCKDNFLVLKGTTTQSPIFTIGSVIKDALEKNCELWLVLQNMRKAYDSVGWKHLEKSLVRIKMCSKFIRFFGMMTDFGLTGGYHVYDGLDQGEVFSLLLWRIFYDSLLCEVKRQESVCGYRLNSYFISKNGRAETWAGLSSFFAAGAFVDDTIWVGNSQAATQHILDIASEFFQVNNISVNNDKTVAIPINSRVSSLSLSISGSPISVAKKREPHWYLGIFLLTEGLLKPSLAKANSDVRFFVNLVLRKAISDKQFLYLVLAVFQPIINALVCKGLKLKSGLPLDFPSDMLHHPSFYGLKSFSQIQSECKVASLVSFVNSGGILGCLFSHRSHDLQVQCWCPVHPLNFPVRVNISASNNFLAGLVHILLDCNLSLGGSFVSSFWSSSSAPMSTVLGKSKFSKFLSSFCQFGIAFVDQLRDCHDAIFDWYIFKWWKRLDPRGTISEWFRLATAFFNDASLLSDDQFVSDGAVYQDILGSTDYASVCGRLSQVISGSLSVYTNGSLRSLGTAAFFEDIGLGLEVGVSGLMSSTLVELQAIALAIECVPLSCSIHVFSDSQFALSACESEMDLYWIKCQHIANVICSKNLRVSWHKVKGYSGVSGNKRADEIVGIVSLSSWRLHSRLDEHFLVADGGVILGNSKHFVHDICQSICCACWEVGSGTRFLKDNMLFDIDWFCSFMVWHPDLHMATGFISRLSANARTYFMKALHHQLPVAMRKRLYNKYYLSVLCLYCGDVESLDHVFFCKVNDSTHSQILDSHVASWKAFTGLSLFSSAIIQLLLSCASDFPVFVALCKGFVFNDWFREAVSVFRDPKIAGLKVVKFVRSLGLAFRNDVWMVHAKHYAYMKKAKLILLDGSTPVSVSGLVSGFSTGVVKLLDITKAVSIRFGFCKPCLFFSGVGSLVSVRISE